MSWIIMATRELEEAAKDRDAGQLQDAAAGALLGIGYALLAMHMALPDEDGPDPDAGSHERT